MHGFKHMFEYWQTCATQCKYFDTLKQHKKNAAALGHDVLEFCYRRLVQWRLAGAPLAT